MLPYWLLTFLLLVVTSTYLLYKYATRKFDYWKKKGIFYVKPIPFIGSALEVFLFKTTIGQWLQKCYNMTDEPVFGIFILDEPFLVIKSPEIVKHVLVKDFNYFNERSMASPKHSEILSNLTALQRNPEWKIFRSKMSPIFSSGKLKGMCSIFNSVGKEMNLYIEKHLGPLEAKELALKYSSEVIAKCAFGINAFSFEDENADFIKNGRAIFKFSLRNGFVQLSYFFAQKLVHFFQLDFIEKSITDYLSQAFWNVVKRREETGTKGNDFVDMLIDMSHNDELRKELNFEGDRVAAQAVQFVAAGFESTSGTISFALYELSIHPKIQDELRNEILLNINKYDGITYEGIQEMKYLDACIKETMRKYPTLPFLGRICNENYKIPETDIIIEKDMMVFIPVFGLHYDEKYFPEPEKFQPERFFGNIFSKMYYLPFGEGPRGCIGERFGMLSTKIALVHILSKYEVHRNERTPVPLVFEVKCLTVQSKFGLSITFKKIVPPSN